MHSYQSALGMKRDSASSEGLIVDGRSRTNTTIRQNNSEESVASQGNDHRINLDNK